jgi:hypothetical protein
MPGFMNSGTEYAQPFKKVLQQSKNTLVVNHPEGSFDESRTYEAVASTMEANNLRNPSFLVESMSGEGVVDFLHRYRDNGDAERFGEVETVVLVEPVLGPDTIQPAAREIGLRILSNEGAKYSWLFNTVIKPLTLSQYIPPNEGNVPPELVPLTEPNRQYILHAPMPGVAEQARSMMTPLRHNSSIEGVARNVYVIYPPQPEKDIFVNYEASLAACRRLFGTDAVTHITDFARPPGSHGLTAHYPEVAVSLLTQDAA